MRINILNKFLYFFLFVGRENSYDHMYFSITIRAVKRRKRKKKVIQELVPFLENK